MSLEKISTRFVPGTSRYRRYQANDGDVLCDQAHETPGTPPEVTPPPQYKDGVSNGCVVEVVVAGGTVVLTASGGRTTVGVECSPGAGAGVVGRGWAKGAVVGVSGGAAEGGSHGGATTVVGVGTEDGGASFGGAGAVTPGSAVFTSRGWALLGK